MLNFNAMRPFFLLPVFMLGLIVFVAIRAGALEYAPDLLREVGILQEEMPFVQERVSSETLAAAPPVRRASPFLFVANPVLRVNIPRESVFSPSPPLACQCASAWFGPVQ